MPEDFRMAISAATASGVLQAQQTDTHAAPTSRRPMMWSVLLTRRPMEAKICIASRGPLEPESTRACDVLGASAPIRSGCRSDGAQHMHRFAGVIPHNVSAPDAGHHHAVGSLHTMLDSNIRLEGIQNLRCRMRQETGILRQE